MLIDTRTTDGREHKVNGPTSFEHVKYVSEDKLLDFFQSLILYLLINKTASCFWYSTFHFRMRQKFCSRILWKTDM